jgi:DNA-binding NarL/FixJ family response regulator
MKILIADDHELFLQGLQFVLQHNFKDATIETAQNYTQIFEHLKNAQTYDLIITDLAMPGANYFDALAEMHRLAGETPIIIMSAIFDKGILERTIEAGVSGYIPKSTSNQLMLSAINLVLAGGVYIPHEMLDNAVENQEMKLELNKMRQMSDLETGRSVKKLTPRQIEVVKAMSLGLPNKLIAYKLGLTEGTVKVHVTVILKVLGVTNRTGAVMEAVKRGYLTPEEVSM